MSQSTAGERATAALSALAALLILGAAVTADQSDSVPSSRLTALESDLRFQLNLAHRLNGETLKARLAEVDQTLAAWRESPQSGDDYRMLVAWLESSIDRSLPGDSGELPPVPKFGAAPPPVVVAPPAPAPTPALSPPSTARSSAPAPQAALPLAATKPTIERPTAAPVAKSPPTPQPAKHLEPIKPAPAVEHSVAVEPQSPAPTEQPTPTTPPRAAPPAPQATPAALTSVVAKPVEINLSELNSRIAGYHEGMKAIESALVADREQLTQERLGKLVDRLEQLANQYGFVNLYYDTLSADERRAVTAPRPLTATVELVQRQLARLEHSGEADVLSAFEAPTSDDPNSLAARLQAIAQQASDTAAAR